MDRFIALVKKKMLGEQTAEEELELNRLFESRNELKQLYDHAFANLDLASPQDRLEAEKAYAVHFVKMHLRGAFKE